MFRQSFNGFNDDVFGLAARWRSRRPRLRTAKDTAAARRATNARRESLSLSLFLSLSLYVYIYIYVISLSLSTYMLYIYVYMCMLYIYMLCIHTYMYYIHICIYTYIYIYILVMHTYMYTCRAARDKSLAARVGRGPFLLLFIPMIPIIPLLLPINSYYSFITTIHS